MVDVMSLDLLCTFPYRCGFHRWRLPVCEHVYPEASGGGYRDLGWEPVPSDQTWGGGLDD